MPIGDSKSQLINCSTIEETVLGCKPETRDRSARAIGWRDRTSSKPHRDWFHAPFHL